MAKFHVWHADPPNFVGDVEAARQWPLGYRFAAIVEVPDTIEQVLQLEKVFELTNHIDHDWTTNPQVVGIRPPQRSTSVGDVIFLGDTTDVWMVASLGFTPINPWTDRKAVS